MTTARRWIGSGILCLLLSASVQAQLETIWQVGEIGYEVQNLVLLPDGSSMIVDSNRLRLWRLPEGHLLFTFPWSFRLGSQHALSSDGEFLLTVGFGAFYVWRLSDRSIAYEVPAPMLGEGTAGIESAFLTPDGRYIIASLYGCEYSEPDGYCYEYIYAVARLQVSNGGIVWAQTTEDDALDVLAMSPDGHWLVVSVVLSSVQVLDAQTGELRYTLPVSATSAAFSPDSQQFALGTWGGTITLHRTVDGAVVRTLSNAHQNGVKALTFSPDGAQLASVGGDGFVRIWNLADGTLIRSLRAHSYSISTALFLGTESLLTAGSERLGTSSTGSIKRWRLSDGSLVQEWAGHGGRMTRTTFSPDGEKLATAGLDGAIYLWRTGDGNVLRRLFSEPVEQSVYALRFAPDGGTLASGGQDGMLRLWDVVRGGFPHFFLAHSGGITSLRYSPDGSMVITGGYDRMVKLWDATTRLLVRTLSGHLGGVSALDVSPDGSLIASASFDETVRLWHAPTGALLSVLRGHRGVVWSVDFSPDGSYLFSGGADGTVRMWDVRTGNLIRMWQAHSGGVYQLAISPAGHLLASLGEDEALRFWNAHTGALLFTPTFPAHYRPAAFAFSPITPYFAYVLHYVENQGYISDSLLRLARVHMPGDVDENGCVDDSDLLMVLFAFGQTGTDLSEDVNRDGIVDDSDLLTVLFNWGIGC